ncbi:hypothetical protein [Rhizobium sp. TRM95796]|uniref:hypothetical protein n=1 Tax=Rhizobium sp. TRM95796 TaxID=2979862 RepID=UPI0021E7F782|nr:hypothetical protein [Rhizobium sp. TRM95796]MCV3764926.1 hypothetical protein [Rhizobium sp. TRM95796]
MMIDPIRSSRLALALSSLLLYSGAHAQTLAPREETTGSIPAPGLHQGTSSYSQAQARARMEAMGFVAIGELWLDNKGVWRGVATSGARRVDVSLDNQGKVAARPRIDLN